MAHLLIVKAGDAFPEVIDAHGDFEALFQCQLETALPPGLTLQVFDAPRESTLPELSSLAGLVITGSHSMVSAEEPWSEALKPWLVEALERDIPMLGVCYGHQLMASAFGGISDYHPAGRESGTRQVMLSEEAQDDALLGELPQLFYAHLTHAQSVLTPPKNARILAGNKHDPHQALRYGPHQWSVQFHPEFTVSVMHAYLERQRSALRDQGEDPQVLMDAVRATPEATALLARFVALLRVTPVS
ncbi:glutamine amidotransferase [Vreelandella rituensis]|uniref:Glutamine amidotransferase n=1 Tax=Vreelandella rituensis TaxID=2282306 RepID=A0A368U9X1_9GAMM|nr:glutamine amidotransferase [Halomonas rituensis]RCV92922.1 glutamine amidotransferase [Halomonas rituensis]